MPAIRGTYLSKLRVVLQAENLVTVHMTTYSLIGLIGYLKLNYKNESSKILFTTESLFLMTKWLNLTLKIF